MDRTIAGIACALLLAAATATGALGDPPARAPVDHVYMQVDGLG